MRRGCFKGGGSIDEAIPSTALLAWRVRFGNFVQSVMRTVGVPDDESMLGPPGEGRFVDVEARSCFLFGEHSAVSEPIVTRTERVVGRGPR